MVPIGVVWMSLLADKTRSQLADSAGELQDIWAGCGIIFAMVELKLWNRSFKA